jgi:3-deoxy-D-manno-octulosonic-acid transferase
MGPHTYNFEEAASLAANAGVAFRADSLESAIVYALALCIPNGFDANAASDFVAKHRGAAAKTAEAIRALLPS